MKTIILKEDDPLNTFVATSIERELLPVLDALILRYGLAETEGQKMIIEAMQIDKFQGFVYLLVLKDIIHWAVMIGYLIRSRKMSAKGLRAFAKEKNVSLAFLQHVLAIHQDFLENKISSLYLKFPNETEGENA